MIKFKFVKNRGESLFEVLVAVGIMVVVLVVSLMLVNRGISTNVSVKNKIIAINIAREGLEGIRNIRDSNWLKYSGDRRGKWLCWDKEENMNCPYKISNGKYIVDFNKTHSRFLVNKPEEIQDSIDLKNSTIDFSDYKLYKSPEGRYTHQNTGNEESIFYRQIRLNGESPEECTRNCRINVSSRVQWKENDLIGSVVLETYLYDYYDRKNFAE